MTNNIAEIEQEAIKVPDNGWKNVRPRRRMVSHDKGYQGSERKKRRPAAKYSFFGGKGWK